VKGAGQSPGTLQQDETVEQQPSLSILDKALGQHDWPEGHDPVRPSAVPAGQQVSLATAQVPNWFSGVGSQHFGRADGHEPPPCATVQQVRPAALQLTPSTKKTSGQQSGNSDEQQPGPQATGRSPVHLCTGFFFFFFFLCRFPASTSSTALRLVMPNVDAASAPTPARSRPRRDAPPIALRSNASNRSPST